MALVIEERAHTGDVLVVLVDVAHEDPLGVRHATPMRRLCVFQGYASRAEAGRDTRGLLVLAPVLEIYVVWHPGDSEGEWITELVLDHFRGTAFSGLIGGAVEVFVRSVSATSDPAGMPRPLPCVEPMPYGVPTPALTAVILIAGAELAAAVQSRHGPWHDYIETLAIARRVAPDRVGIFSVRVADHVFDDTVLGGLVGDVLDIASGAFGTDAFGETLCRDLAQGIAQMGSHLNRVKVFVSHTKRLSVVEQPAVSSLVQLVRDVIATTRLGEFFDAHDLQPNEDWVHALDEAAATGALLAVRTDLYSSRPWCQREVLTAKRNGMPVVVLDALTAGEERGSFVMDHVPRMPGRQVDDEWRRSDVVRVLGQLVDECLKRVLWRKQREIAVATGLPVDIDWWAPHAPEPSTFVAWLDDHDDLDAQRREPIVVLHPDPPLGPDERDVLKQIARLAHLHEEIEFLTPRGLAARGG